MVAPSSPFPLEHFWPGLAWLRARYRVRMSAGALEREGYLAGTDSRRRAELARALADGEVRAVVAARGGYGSMRILDEIAWDELARRPRWLVGFSDVTALHAMAWRAGVASVHGPNVTGLGRDASPAVRAAWLAAVERPSAAHAWRGLRVLRPGSAAGCIVGGNLTLVHAMAAGGRLSIPRGAVLALEDVTEAPYRVDRMLTSLLLGGHLAEVSAIVFGAFDRCEAVAGGPTIDEVIEERARAFHVPVLAGAPFGHAAHNEAFVLGSRVQVTGDAVQFVAG